MRKTFLLIILLLTFALYLVNASYANKSQQQEITVKDDNYVEKVSDYRVIANKELILNDDENEIDLNITNLSNLNISYLLYLNPINECDDMLFSINNSSPQKYVDQLMIINMDYFKSNNDNISLNVKIWSPTCPIYEYEIKLKKYAILGGEK